MSDLISRKVLKNLINDKSIPIKFEEEKRGNWQNSTCVLLSDIYKAIDNAPIAEKPKGEYEFIEILAQYVPDDICTYPEYKGKPYYSIHYKQNGEEFVGFGTYKIEVLSRYLKDYFMKGGAEYEQRFNQP